MGLSSCRSWLSLICLRAIPQQALKYYKMADSLEPKGFYTAKTAVYALEGERSGKFPAGTYAAFLQIEFDRRSG